MSSHDYLTVKEVTAQYPFSMGTFRRLLFERRTNGMEKAVLQRERKIIIFRPALEEWIHEYYASQAAPKKSSLIKKGKKK